MLLVVDFLKISANSRTKAFLRLSWIYGLLFCYFDGKEGNKIQNWKYEHYYICAIALEWF